MAQLTQAQQTAALNAFTQSQEFLALPEGRDRYNAYVDALAAITGDSNGPQNAGSGGFFQNIPGQSGLETAITRAIGVATGIAITGGLLSGGASAAPGAAATTGGTGAATGGAAAGDTAAGVLPSTTIGSGFVPAITGGTSAGAGTATGVGLTGAGLTGAGVVGGSALAGTSASWLAPLIGGATSAAGTIVGGLIASNAAGTASAAQAQTAADALAFDKQAYADMVGRLTPYINAGTGAITHATALLNAGSQGTQPANYSPLATSQPLANGATYGPAAPVPLPTSTPLAAPSPQSGTQVQPGYVLLASPDGVTKAVPASQAQHYISLGATPVNG
jgi:hypothetical protein